jgi:NAD(P)-dependent dehydrogenase (short-subunit alcohol dehydrogenase family)
MLGGKIAVVTGAGRGIGREHALRLAAAGAKVVVNDYGSEWDGTGQDSRPAQLVVDEIVAKGGTAVANYDDVADWNGGANAVNAALEQYGGVDILICNAGFVRDRMLFNMSEEEWDSVIRVHLKGHFVPTRAAARYWRERAKTTGVSARASVVYTSSASGLYSNAGQTNYDAAKAGIASMAVAVARELAGYGVRVNAISPSARTRMTQQTFQVDPRGSTAARDFDPLDPANISPWVVWLCTEAAADVTGQVFEVRGGTVYLLKGWNRIAHIHKDGLWNLDELTARAKDLFTTEAPGTPSMPDFTLTP